MIQTGKKVPVFELESSAGGRLSIGDLKGKYAVIVIYPKNNTPG